MHQLHQLIEWICLFSKDELDIEVYMGLKGVGIHTKSSEMGEFGGVIRHGTHEPICGGLPHRV